MSTAEHNGIALEKKAMYETVPSALYVLFVAVTSLRPYMIQQNVGKRVVLTSYVEIELVYVLDEPLKTMYDISNDWTEIRSFEQPFAER